MPPQQFRGYSAFLFGFGIFLLAVAGIFAANQSMRVQVPQTGVVEVANTVAGMAACGFAIAGGLCFVAAALVYLADQQNGRKAGESPRPPGPDEPGVRTP